MKKINHRRFIRAINTARRNGWVSDHWPLDDAKFEIDCCLSSGELLWDKGFQNALGRIEWIKLVNRITDSVMTYEILPGDKEYDLYDKN